MTTKQCRCGVLFYHPTESDCATCGERVWPCGHSRATGQQQCDREACRLEAKLRDRRERKKRDKGKSKGKGNVVTIRRAI